MYLGVLLLNALLFITFLLKSLTIRSRSSSSKERADSRPIHVDTNSIDDPAPRVDYISSLPSAIIEKILGHLPLREIVRTSLLSREWRYKWQTCTELVFDIWFDQMFLNGHKLEPIVCHVLKHHRGPLLKFVVQVPQLRSCPEIDEWLHLLPKDNLQDLTLRVSIGGKHRLTSYLCSFRHLRNLRLGSCMFDPPLGFEGFNKLVSLDLQSVGLEPNRFGTFVASCSAIERLRLFHCTTFDCLEITGPKLKLLEFRGLFSSISFKNCPVLTDVRLDFSPDLTIADGFSLSLVESLSCLPAMEELHLQARALEDLVRHGVPYKLAIALKSLKNLHLKDMYFEKTAETGSALCFIRSCPILQRLRITVSFNMNFVQGVKNQTNYVGTFLQAYTFEVVGSVASFLRSQETSNCLTQLKAVKMQLFCGNDSEMEFMKYILASAAALEEIAITPHAGCITDGGESIINKLKQFPRACARVTFNSLN